jgi:hypothetical protein
LRAGAAGFGGFERCATFGFGAAPGFGAAAEVRTVVHISHAARLASFTKVPVP